MRGLPFLDERLALLASLVRAGSIAADIGSDHGHLITWLVGRGVCPHGYACDINKKPLEQSRATALRFGCEGKISFVLSNGLAELNEADIDDIIIAGMGGDLIAEILSAAGWHSAGKQFLLQPMTRADELRRWLCANGYELCSEHAAQANGFCYTAITSRYTGKVYPCTPLFAAVGIMPQVRTPEAKAYILKQAEAVKKKLLGLAASKNHLADEMLPLQGLYDSILATLEETSP